MPVLIRIAFRNMWEHKAKSLIIGSLVALGVIIIVIGNAMIDSAASGLRQSYIDGFTGDMMISGKSEAPLSIFGVQSMDMSGDDETPILPDYEKVLARVQEDPRVESATGLAVAFGLLSADEDEDAWTDAETDQENMIFGLLFGVDPDSYFKTFKAVEILDGRIFARGEAGLLITEQHRERLTKKYKREISPGDTILLNGFSAAGMRIREVTITGIYKRGDVNGQAPFMITDIDTARVLSGLTLSDEASIELEDNQTSLLSAGSADDIFGDAAFSGSMVERASGSSLSANLDNAASLLGDTSARERLNQADAGAWQFLLVRMKDSLAAPGAIKDYTAWIEEQGLEAQVTDWKGAAGMAGQSADIIRIIFNIAILIVSIVAVIIMMNTLVISVIERTAEIGTMRALGAQKKFVRRMFFTETLTITVFFGLMGAALATTVCLVLNALHIPLENEFAQLLLGGKVMHLVPGIASFAATIVGVFFIAWLAHLYPVSIALKIQPVKAMQTD